MTVLVTLDIGNHAAKAAIWENGQMTHARSLHDLSPDELGDYALASAQVGSLTESEQEHFEELHAKAKFSFKVRDYFKKGSFIEMPVHYAETLGTDRLIAAYKVFRDYHSAGHSQSYSLVVDAGSFVTLDLVSKKGFLGGHIFPSSHQWGKAYQDGLQLQEHLGENASGLLTDFRADELPQNSHDAIFQSYPLALSGALHQLVHHFHPQRLIFCGGEGEEVRALAQDVLGPVSLIGSPTLVHEGLLLALQGLTKHN